MKIDNVFYLQSGRIFVAKTDDNHFIEFTEMRDVKTASKENEEVRNTQDTRIIWKHLDKFTNKWLMTVSTQIGCTHKCKFCDVALLKFKRNLSEYEIWWQIEQIINCTPYVEFTNKAKIGFARMGEPAHNFKAVSGVITNLKRFNGFNWLPCFNSILPLKTIEGLTAQDVLMQMISIKENVYSGFLHLQLSVNSTDEEKRKYLFGGARVMPLDEIINIVNKTIITNRKVTLNFIVMKDIPVDILVLKKMNINSDKIIVKLIPLNQTDIAKKTNLETYANYSNYDKLVQLRNDFKKEGIETVVDTIARCEDAGLCCGQIIHTHYE
jgi:23S rRNA (adenine2503-C2)-methyltransferase